ncbi:hypothetical protein ACU4HD_14170 [Cupriavidus basilensis]
MATNLHGCPHERHFFCDATPAQKGALLGSEFRNIAVLDVDFVDGVAFTRVVMLSRVVTLCGHPQEALTAFVAREVGGRS